MHEWAPGERERHLAEIDESAEPMRAANLYVLRGRARQELGRLERADDLREAMRLVAVDPESELAATVYAHQAALDFLLGKMPQARATTDVITRQDLDGATADHFHWVKTPAAIAQRIASWVAAQEAASANASPPAP